VACKIVILMKIKTLQSIIMSCRILEIHRPWAMTIIIYLKHANYPIPMTNFTNIYTGTAPARRHSKTNWVKLPTCQYTYIEWTSRRRTTVKVAFHHHDIYSNTSQPTLLIQTETTVLVLIFGIRQRVESLQSPLTPRYDLLSAVVIDCWLIQ
jgi:hypothetical protein